MRQMKTIPECNKCSNEAVMVDYCLDLVDCFSHADLSTVNYNSWQSNGNQHDRKCYFPAPRYYCWMHWGILADYVDNWPFQETINTWLTKNRPTKEGFRSLAHLRSMYAKPRSTPAGNPFGLRE